MQNRVSQVETSAIHALGYRHRIRTISYWTFTVLLVFELVAGSLWNLLQIEWVRVQLNHLGYPLYLTYILAVWEIGGAAVIIAPGFALLKQWAYAGCLFNFSGAVASHLLAGDGVRAWLAPLVFLMFVIVSWALRPADRRLPTVGLAPKTRPLAWAVPIGILLLLFVVAYLTLPEGPPPYYHAARDDVERRGAASKVSTSLVSDFRYPRQNMMPTAESERNTATLRRLIDGMNTNDVEIISKTIDELVEPNVVVRNPLPLDVPGAQGLKLVFTTLHRAYPDLHITIEDLIAEGDKVVVRNSVTGTHQGEYMGIPPTGKAVTYNEIFIARFVNGRVAEAWGVVDVLTQMRQLGVIPASRRPNGE